MNALVLCVTGLGGLGACLITVLFFFQVEGEEAASIMGEDIGVNFSSMLQSNLVGTDGVDHHSGLPSHVCYLLLLVEVMKHSMIVQLGPKLHIACTAACINYAIAYFSEMWHHCTSFFNPPPSLFSFHLSPKRSGEGREESR